MANPTPQQLAAAGGTNITRTGGETTPFPSSNRYPIGGQPTSANAAQAPNQTPQTVSTNNPAATPPQGTTSQGQSASAVIVAWAQSVGLGALAPWINQRATTFAAQGMSPADIASQIESTINTAPGFDQVLPGYNARLKNGYDNGGGIGAYMQYLTQAKEIANAAGLPQGFMSNQEIGALWAGDVSTSELSTRVTQEFANAMSAPPEVRQHLQDYYGISTGGLAAYYLDPEKSLPLLQQQFNAASVGAAGTTTGFGEMGKASAQTLAAFLASPTSGGPGTVSEAQAAGALTSSLGNGMTGAAQMATAGFEQALPGQASGPNVVTQAQLLGAVEGDAGALAEARRATETRSAGSRGGGGFAETTGGVTGVAFGSQQ